MLFSAILGVFRSKTCLDLDIVALSFVFVD